MNVLLLHAWPYDERMWDEHAKLLRGAGFAPTAPRLYGRGPSIDGWAAQLLGELEGPFVAVGASMGGYCALRLAGRAPERVLGLVLAGARAGADSSARRLFRADEIESLRTVGVPEDCPTDASAEDLAVAQEALRDRPDAAGVVAAFGGPLLVCVGDGDELLSVDEARALAEGALLGSLEVFAGAGHLLTIDQSDRFGAVLLDFLSPWT